MQCTCINPDCQALVEDVTLGKCPECGTALRLLQRYVLREPLREINPLHGMAVYAAYDEKLKVECVIKVLLYPKPPYLKHFEQEAALLGNLRHPGLPKVDIDDGYFSVTTTAKKYSTLQCFAMEKVPGITLAQWLSQGEKLSQDQAIDWMHQIIAILHELHSHQVFHRDIKPSNIMLRPDGRLVLIDFGAVRSVSDTYLNKLADRDTKLDGVTIFNSPGYTPYEQTQGRAVMQSDFYALAQTLIHLLTGISPHKIKQRENGQLVWRSLAPGVSPPLADLLDQMGSLMPHERPANTLAIQAALAKLPKQIVAYRRSHSPWIKGVKIFGSLCLAGGLLKGISWYLSNNYLNTGLQMAIQGNFIGSRDQLEAAITYDPYNAILHGNLATVCQQLGTEKGEKCAIAHYQRAIALNPSNAAIRYNLASFYGDIGEFTKAQKEYKILLDKTPDFVDARNNLARLQILENQYGEAAQSLNLALPQAHDNLSRSAVLKNLGWLRYQQKDYGEAIKALSEAVKLSPEERTDAYCLLAKSVDAKPKKGASNEFWQRCLSGDVSTPEAKQWQNEKLDRLLSEPNPS
jgi:serine/threonine protein kinase